MAFLIDADVIIQAERKKLDLEAWLRAHPADEIKLAAITVAELWRSVERATGDRRDKRQKYLQAFCPCLKSLLTPRKQPWNMRGCGPTSKPRDRE